MSGGGTAGLSQRAQALLAERAAITTTRANAAECGPLSFPQLTQWFFAQLHPQSAVFNLPKVLSLHGDVDIEALRQSLQSIVDRHAALRTRFTLEGGEPRQRIVAARPVELRVADGFPSDALKAVAELDADSARPFDLANDQLLRAALVRVGETDWQLQLTLHHIACDGWSTNVLLAELEAGYRAARTGSAARVPPLETDVATIAAWQRAQEGTAAYLADVQYWRDQLRDAPPPALPFDFATGRLQAHRATQLRQRLSSQSWSRVAEFGRARQCTPFAITFAAWCTLVARRCDQTACMLGATFAGRTRSEWEPLIGNFVTMAPFAVDLDRTPTFLALVAEIAWWTASALAHEHVPVHEIVPRIAGPRRSGIDTLFPALFNYRNLPLNVPASLHDVAVTGFATPSRGTTAPLALTVIPAADGATLELEIDPDQIAPDTAARWLDAYVTLLDAATRAPSGSLRSLPVMGSSERAQLENWNDTGRAREVADTLPGRFAQQADASPDRIAVVARDTRMTYRQLDLHAGRIAALLRDRGLGPGSIVAVCMDRCAGQVAALVGVQYSGAACLPIDPTYPASRISAMLDDAAVAAVIGGPGSPAILRANRSGFFIWDAAPGAAPEESLPARVEPDAAAYIMYTSGSTGVPKAAVLTHAGIANHLAWMQSTFPLEPDDAVLQRTSIGFDVSIWETWGPIVAGARIVLPPREHDSDPAALVEQMRRESVSVIQVVPTLLRALLDVAAFRAVATLRLVCCGGETMTRELIADFGRTHHARLVNLYGPTETTIDATWWPVEEGDDDRPVPIGRPIANVSVHVVDAVGQPVAIGTPGELYVGGEGVAAGYLNRPELTAERFVPDTFAARPGQKMYRTGDRGRWRHDGLLEFLGRTDHQLKLRGYRIEVGEIEAALGKVAGVDAGAVTVRNRAGIAHDLIAFVTLAEPGSLDPAAVRAALRRDLPEPMIPATVVILESLPLISSGKIDRQALSAVADAYAGRHNDNTETDAESTLEYALRQVWARVLGVDRVGLDDDFFELGGHSLTATKMAHELEDATGFRLPIAVLFEASTIRSLLPQLLTRAYPKGADALREIRRGRPDRPPFFMLTGDLTGGGFYCRGLAAAIDAGQSLYAIPPTTPGTAPDRVRINQMASAHLADVRRVQPNGPYRLGGFCIGGLVAYEMARQLEADGEVVDLLLLVDASAPGRFEPVSHLVAKLASWFSGGDRIARLDRLAYVKKRADEFATLPIGQFVTATATYPLRALQRLVTRRADPASDEAHVGAESLYRQTMAHHARAQQLYRPGRYGGRVDLVRTADPERSAAEHVASWRRVAPATVLHEVTAGHSEVVFTHLPGLLRDQLARVDGAGR